MAIIKCKMCGGDLELKPDATVAECEYCGSVQTVPSADSEKKMSMFARAGKLRSECEFDKAAGIYEAILTEFPVEAEAWWGLVLCKYGIEYVDDPKTGKKIPTCHRSSFDSVPDDGSFLQVMEFADTVARKVYREEAKEIERLRRRILEVSSGEEPYDIFICYKETDELGGRTVDSVMAQEIYHALSDKGYRVFFSRITLEDKLGQEYEPYIFAALQSAKIMLAVGTCDDYYNAVWVKNEWSRFLQLKEAGMDKILIPCYKNIDAYDMPREFAHLQAQDLGKVGAMQDLLRGIEKILPKNQPAAQNAAAQQAAPAAASYSVLLERGNMALEDGDFASADKFFEEVLNHDAKCALAYIGKALAAARCKSLHEMTRNYDTAKPVEQKKTLREESAHIDSMTEQYAVPGYLEKSRIAEQYEFDRSYPTQLPSACNLREEAMQRWNGQKLLSRAMQFAAGTEKAQLEEATAALKSRLDGRVRDAQTAEEAVRAKKQAEYKAFLEKADADVIRMHGEAAGRRQQDYDRCCHAIEQKSFIRELNSAVDGLTKMEGYAESAEMIRRGKEKIKRLEQEETERKQRAWDEETARLAAEAAAKKKKQNIAKIVAAAIAALILAAVLVWNFVIKPANAYKAAEALLASGDYDGAIAGFAALADYKDSSARREEAMDAKYKAAYAEAETLLAAGDQVHAAMAFGAIPEYKDSQERSFAMWRKILTYETVGAGQEHAAWLCADGTVKTDGTNKHGQRNVESWTDIVAISVGQHITVGLRSDGTVVAAGYNDYEACEVRSWTDIVAISTDGSHTAGLKADGTVVATGYNDSGACNVSEWTDIVAIAVGGTHTVGLRSDGTVIAAGNDMQDQCKVEDWSDIIAIDAGEYHTIGLRSDGTVLAAGPRDSLFFDNGQCEVEDWSNIVAIAAGCTHTLGLRADGTVVAADEEGKYVGSEVYGWTDVVSITAGRYNCFGFQSDGILLSDVSYDYAAWDVATPAINETQQAAANAALDHMKIRYAEAEAMAEAGEYREAVPAFRELGEYKDAPQRILELWGEFAPRTTVSAGGDHTVALKADGTVMATGSNHSNQCDVSGWTDIVEVAAGDWLTAALRSDGTVLVVSSYQYYGVAKDDITTWTDIVSISAGNDHVVGLKTDGTVVAAGLNEYGQCEVSDWTDIVAISAGGTHTVGLRADGTAVACGNLERGRCFVDSWTDIVAISGGAAHTVGLKADGTVVAVGGVGDGECNVSGWTDIVAISASYRTIGLKADGTVVATGTNRNGECEVSGWTDIVAVSAGDYHTVGIKADGTAVAVGDNDYGETAVSGWRDIRVPE